MLTNTTNVNRYQIVGTPLSTYSISYPYWDKSEIVVYLTESDGSLTTLTEGTNYTLSAPNGNNGTLTRVGDWTAGATNLTIIREMSFTQEVDLRNGDKIDAETLETALDDLTAQVQQLAESQSRAVESSVDEAGLSLTIPNKTARIGSGSGTMMGFGSDGESIALRDLAQFDADVASAASDASSASTSASNAQYEALRSEGFAVGEQNNMPVGNTSPYYHNNSKYYSLVAKAGADVIEDNITAINTISANISDINDVADDITNIVAVAGDQSNIDSVAGDLTNIDAVNSNKTNIDTVAGISSDVTTVAGISSDVTAVAGATTDIAAILPDIADVTAVAGDLSKVTAVADDLTKIDAVEADLTNVDTVADDISNVNAVGGNISNVNAVAGNATNINAVNANKTNIDTVASKTSDITTVAGKANDISTVAGIASNITTVAGKSTEVTTVAGIASDVSAVAAIDDDIAAVADELTDIGTVVTNLTDISSVASDITKVTAVADDLTNIDAVADELTDIGTVVTNMSDITTVSGDITKITAVADDLTNIDAVADDLTNIDAAPSYALEAEGWANGTQGGTPVTSGSPYYENNAKYWADAVPALQAKTDSLQKQIDNITEAEDLLDTVEYKEGEDAVPENKSKYAEVDTLVGVSRINCQILPPISTTYYNAGPNGSISDGVLTITGNNTADQKSNVGVIGRKYLFIATVKNSVSGTARFVNYLKLSDRNITIPTTSIWTQVKSVFTANTVNTINTDVSSYESGTLQVKDMCLKDLNTHFASDPSVDIAALSLSDIESKYPELLKPTATDTGTKVNTEYTSVTAIGRNRLKPSTFKARLIELGGTDNGDGTVTISASQIYNQVIWDNDTGSDIISFCFAGSGYSNLGIQYSDYSTDGILSLTSDGTWKTSSSSYVVKRLIGIWVSGNTTFTIDKCGIFAGSTNTFEDYVENTLSLGQTVKLGSAGSVHEKFYLESGKKTNPLGSFDGTDMTFVRLTEQGLNLYIMHTSPLAKPASANVINSFGLDVVSSFDSSTETNEVIQKATSEGDIYVLLKTSRTLADFDVSYELATPSADTQLIPVINNLVETQSKGTIRPDQSQTIKIDTDMIVTYTNKVTQ